MPFAACCQDVDEEMTIFVVGNGGVGKSSMLNKKCNVRCYCARAHSTSRHAAVSPKLRRLLQDIRPGTYKKTIGSKYFRTNMTVDGKTTELSLWDTAGQSEFDKMRARELSSRGQSLIRLQSPFSFAASEGRPLC